MFTLSHVYKSYGSNVVLADISFSIEKGQKIALVGNNGTGKSTLLKIIAGLEDVDGGEALLQKGKVAAYLPQDVGSIGEISNGQTIADHIGLEKYEGHKILSMMAGFGMEYLPFDRKMSRLSSGQKTKIALIKILLQDADILLLDEPTNNLDIPALIWLEDFLKSSSLACVIVSHDRCFLDNVAAKIVELDWESHTAIISSGTYSDYIENSLKKRDWLMKQYERQQEQIVDLEKELREHKDRAEGKGKGEPTDNDKFLQGFKSDRIGKGSGRRVRAIESKLKQIEEIKRPVERNMLEISLDRGADHGALDIELNDVLAGYEKEIPGRSAGFFIGPISLPIRFGSRVGIIGLNGSGKTTLLRTITGQLTPLSGKVEMGSRVNIGNLTQEHEDLPMGEMLLDFLMERSGIATNDAYNILQKYGFSEIQIKRPIRSLSPGGRARLLFALFTLLSVNTLVLDEPTNHLDSEALLALEEGLSDYNGTVILISHDRYFLERSKLTDTYILEGGKLRKIADYRSYVKDAEAKARKLLRIL